MYVINEYQLLVVSSEAYLNHFKPTLLIPTSQLLSILNCLQTFTLKECQENQLKDLAYAHEVDFNALKNILVEKLAVIKPFLLQKIPTLYLDCEDELITQLLFDTLKTEFRINTLNELQESEKNSLILFYRHDYEDDAFKSLFTNLKPNTYLVSAGLLDQQLIIDNLYFEKSGLPSHFANVQQIKSSFMWQRKIKMEAQKTMPINSCQRAYVAYCLHQFLLQYLHFWGTPTLYDQINRYWQVDLKSFSLKKEVAIDYPFTEIEWAQQVEYFDTKELV